ncbi:hypothetical protein TWF281_001297 [Arthrobotrys megalospora]
MRFSIIPIAVLSLLQTVSAVPASIFPRQSSNRNDLQNGACKQFTLIFARGTEERTNLGSVGTPLAAALAKVLPGGAGDLAVQGVNYAADIRGAIFGGDPKGSQAMAKLVAKACPSTTVILAGYSQGAQLVHNAISQMSKATAKKVGAVVMFGDPKYGRALGKGLNAKSKTFCNPGDQICKGGFNILPSHLTYGSDANAAARFVKSRVT